MRYHDLGRNSIRCVAAAALCVMASTVVAKPRVSVVQKTYVVDATTIQGLKQQMKSRGPNGFWAYTDWYVKWTGNCRLSVKITYRMPKHKNEAALDPSVRKKWRAMTQALKTHEEKHGAHGIQAAQEIEKTRCANGNAILQKWANQDRVLDKRTGHGRSEGVHLN